MHDYKTSLIQDKLKNAGIQSGDTVYCHSNLGFFGRPDKNIKSINLAKIFFDALNEVLGNNGTIILPSYTYSFGSNSINIQKNITNDGDWGLNRQLDIYIEEVTNTDTVVFHVFDDLFNDNAVALLIRKQLNTPQR